MIPALIALRAFYVVTVAAAVTVAALVGAWTSTFNDFYEEMNEMNLSRNGRELHGWTRPWETNFTIFMIILSPAVAVIANIPTVMQKWIYTTPAVVGNGVVAGLWLFDAIIFWGHKGSGGMLDPHFFSRMYKDVFNDPSLLEITKHNKEAMNIANALWGFVFFSTFAWGCIAAMHQIGRMRGWVHPFKRINSFARPPSMKSIRSSFRSKKSTTSDENIEIRIPAPLIDDARMGETVFREAERPIYAKALFDYTAQESTEITFKAGDMVRVHKFTDDPDSWWEGEINGLVGEFPGNYVKMLSGSTRKLSTQI